MTRTSKEEYKVLVLGRGVPDSSIAKALSASIKCYDNESESHAYRGGVFKRGKCKYPVRK